MRGAPHVGFSVTMRKMSSRNSLLTHFLPAWALRREIPAQYSLKPARCQRTTVSGWTRTNARFHPGHTRRNITQKNLSGAAHRGRPYLCFRTPSCCRRARFSRSKSRRERKARANRKGSRPKRRTMRPVLHRSRPVERSRHLPDFNADHDFGELQAVFGNAKKYPPRRRHAGILLNW